MMHAVLIHAYSTTITDVEHLYSRYPQENICMYSLARIVQQSLSYMCIYCRGSENSPQR